MKYLFLLLSIFLFSSCSKVFFGPELSDSPKDCFQYLCETVETRYSLFEVKELDWTGIKSRYASQVKDSMSNEELLDVLGNFLGELQDGHVNIYTNWDYSRNWDWYLDYPANFDDELIYRNYFGKSYWRSGPLHNTIIDSVGYIYYGSFSVPMKSKSLDAVIKRMDNCKGLILDLRNNGGGKLSNVKLLSSRFADTTRTALTFQFKTGPGFNDFTEPFDYIVKPGGSKQFTKPVVILMNRKSYSAATFFPALMSVFPHVTLMGDRSGGGGGIPYHFELPNGWNFRISTTITLDGKGQNIELGIPPEIPVSLDKTLADKGVDSMIEAAKDHILKKEIFWEGHPEE